MDRAFHGTRITRGIALRANHEVLIAVCLLHGSQVGFIEWRMVQVETLHIADHTDDPCRWSIALRKSLTDVLADGAFSREHVPGHGLVDHRDSRRTRGVLLIE